MPSPNAITPSPPLPAARGAARCPVRVYLASVAPGSRAALANIAAIATGTEPQVGRPARLATAIAFPRADLEPHHVAAIRSALAERYRRGTANKALTALRQVMKSAWHIGLIDGERLARINGVPAVRGGTSSRAGRYVTDAEYRRVLADWLPARNRLLIRHGKDGWEREHALPRGAAEVIEAWLAVRGGEHGPLFLAATPARRLRPGARIGISTLFGIVRRRAAEAGVEPFSCHDLRRKLVSDGLDAGIDLAKVSRWAGHSSVTTTAKYDRRGDRALDEAAATLAVPIAISIRAEHNPR